MSSDLKQQIIRGYAKRHGLKIFVETGTFNGEMLSALRNDFELLYSIELDGQWYNLARQRFAHDWRFGIYQGDSAKVLPDVLNHLMWPALFWLDAHYSGPGTAGDAFNAPIRDELKAIAGHSRQDASVILIDDARFFDGTTHYPTLDEVKALVPGRNVVVDEDVIRIT